MLANDDRFNRETIESRGVAEVERKVSWPLAKAFDQLLTSVSPISSLSSILGIVILPWLTKLYV